MPRFFFNLRLEDALLPDPDGEMLPDPDAAFERARRSAQELMRSDFDRPVRWHACSFEVLDQAGEIVFELPFVEAIEGEGFVN